MNNSIRREKIRGRVSDDWKCVVDFTKIKKEGVLLQDVLSVMAREGLE